jgi:acyl-CoA thioester hydrolase
MVVRRRAEPEPARDGAAPPAEDGSPVTRRESRLFSWKVRVYHEDADGSGVVYHANHLKFLERARTEWLRSLGFEQPELAARHGVAFVVRSLAIEYASPASFNDELAITVEAAELKGGQIVLAQRIMRGEVELSRASVRLACVNTASFRPVRIPGDVREALSSI